MSEGNGSSIERRPVTRKELLAAAAAGSAALVAGGIRPARIRAATATLPAAAYPADVPLAWFELALQLVKTTPGFSPPVASRAFGYAGVALYEALVPGGGARSLAGQLNGLALMPAHASPALHWPTVANSALASILRSLFRTAPPAGAAAIEELVRRFAASAQAAIPTDVYGRSVVRGVEVAAHVFAWSRTDGGHAVSCGTSRRSPLPSAPASGCRPRLPSSRRSSPSGARTGPSRFRAAPRARPGRTRPTPK